uniref:Putative ixostatin n=1 Tax=Ixodes ricinus TaxID=34613 RepID=A0A0K8R4D6_IXORI
MILPLSVVLLAASSYLHAVQPNADTCSAELEEHMKTRCSNFNARFHGFSGCSFTCQGKNNLGQDKIMKLNLMDGLPCGLCKECCGGVCTPVKIDFKNQLALESCGQQKGCS